MERLGASITAVDRAFPQPPKIGDLHGLEPIRGASCIDPCALSPIAGAASMTPTQAFLHLPERKGLPAVQARLVALVASHHDHGPALRPLLTGIHGMRRFPAHYYSHGTSKGPVRGGLTRVLTSAFASHSLRARARTERGRRLHACGGPRRAATGHSPALVSAWCHGVAAPRLTALVATYLRRYKAGASAERIPQYQEYALTPRPLDVSPAPGARAFFSDRCSDAR